jgi:tetratricopeptide (TPR) repeat protein
LARAGANPEAAKQDLEEFLKERPDGSPAVYISATRRLVEMFIYIAEILKRDPKLGCNWLQVGAAHLSDLEAPLAIMRVNSNKLFGVEIDESGKLDLRAASHEEVLAFAECISEKIYGFDGLLGEGAVRTEYSRALETLARMAGDLGHLDLAKGYLDRAHQMSTKGADFVAEAVYLCNLGMVVGKMGRLNTAENYLDRALAICQDDPALGVRMIFARTPMSPEEAEQWNVRQRAQSDDAREDEIVLCNRVYEESKRDPESAFRKGMALKETEGNAHANLGIIAWKLGDTAKADREFRRAFDLHRDIRHLFGMAQDLENYGHFALDQGDPKNASACWDQAREIFDRLGKRQRAEELRNRLRAVRNEVMV